MGEDFFSRLDKYMIYSNLNDNQLTRLASLSIGALGKQRKGSRGLSSESIAKILHACPNLDANWLLTGQGEMLKNPTAETDNIPVVPNSFTGLTDDQIQKMIEEAVTNKLLGMYESGVIYSAAAVMELQRQNAELMLENAKLKADATPANKSGIAPQKEKE